MTTSRGRHVLVVEDNQELAECLMTLLEGERFQSVTFPCGKQALSYLEQHPKVDLVIVDLMLLPSMNGIEFLEKVRSVLDDSTRVVITSGTIAHPDDLRHLGVDAVLPKPYDVDVFLDTVHRLVGRPF